MCLLIFCEVFVYPVKYEVFVIFMRNVLTESCIKKDFCE